MSTAILQNNNSSAINRAGNILALQQRDEHTQQGIAEALSFNDENFERGRTVAAITNMNSGTRDAVSILTDSARGS